MQTIQIPDDIYARLQHHAVPLEDSAADVIVRLLDTIEHPPLQPQSSQASNGGGDFFSKGGRIPNGTKLRANYKGRLFYAEIRHGTIWLDGNAYESLSRAIIAVARSVGTRNPSLNGWKYWEYEGPDGIWRPVEQLR